MKYLRIIWDLVKEIAYWFFVGFRFAFCNIHASLMWIFVLLILYFTIFRCAMDLLPRLALWCCIFGLILSSKCYGD